MLVVFLQGSVLYYYAAAGANPISWTKAGVRLCADDVDTSWQTPTFQNSFTSYSSPYACAYRKMPDGTVVVRGLVTVPAASGTIFTLPVGYRPANTIHGQYLFTCQTSFGIWRVDVLSTGAVTPMGLVSGSTGAWSTSGWMSLDGIRFLAEA
jgi:hypothetical protein